HVYGGRRNELGRRNRAGPPRTGKGTSVRGDGGTGAVILRRGDLGEFGGQTASRGVLIAQGRHLGDGLGAVIDTSWRPLRSRTRSGGGPSRQLAHGDLAAGGLGLLLFRSGSPLRLIAAGDRPRPGRRPTPGRCGGDGNGRSDVAVRLGQHALEDGNLRRALPLEGVAQQRSELLLRGLRRHARTKLP